jgi:ubiquinone/menaquinone biosynthesis C-methylase UbiE
MADDASKQAEYAHGHHSTVLKSHTWRTVDNSAAYLVPYIKPDMKILDIGCGPGNITVGLAKLVPQGRCTGLDISEGVLQQARDYAASQSQSNVEFVTGNVFKLDYEDDSFDIVHAHQVLQHLHDPLASIREMKRVVKPGGVVAIRDMTHFLHWPETEEIDKFRRLFYQISDDKGASPGVGCRLHQLAREAGFTGEQIKPTGSMWYYTAYTDLPWWCSKSMSFLICYQD